MTAPTWPKVVAAVEHNRGCRTRQTLRRSHPALAAYALPCDCTRDARIGAGIAAVEAYDLAEPPQKQCEGDCLACNIKIAQQHNERFAAFREATGTKEENDVPMR